MRPVHLYGSPNAPCKRVHLSNDKVYQNTRYKTVTKNEPGDINFVTRFTYLSCIAYGVYLRVISTTCPPSMRMVVL